MLVLDKNTEQCLFGTNHWQMKWKLTAYGKHQVSLAESMATIKYGNVFLATILDTTLGNCKMGKPISLKVRHV